jgi:hypothetical protein
MAHPYRFETAYDFLTGRVEDEALTNLAGASD